MTLFEFGAIHGNIRSGFTSSTEVMLVIVKFIFVVIYLFIKHQMALMLIIFCLSAFLLFNFISKNRFIKNTVFTLYLVFLWSRFVCLVVLLLKNS